MLINTVTRLRSASCWKYTTRVVSLSQNLFLRTNHINKSAICFTHETKNIVSWYYKQVENEYYHSYLTKNKKYRKSIAFLDYLNEEKPPTDLKFLDENFQNEGDINLIAYLHGALIAAKKSPDIFHDARFIKLCDTLVSKINGINEDHLLNILKILTLWEAPNRNALFFTICKSIDSTIEYRYRTWGFDRCLQAVDHFYRLEVLRFSQFAWNSMKRLFREPNRLTSAQVVHALFLVNAHRTWHPSVHMYNLECYLSQTVYELGVEECAILAMSFFKTQHRIRNLELIDILYQKLEYRLSTVDSIPLNAFLKFFRYSSYFTLANRQKNLLKQMASILDKHNYFCCTQTALLGTSLLLWNRDTFDKIAQRFINEISTIRLKDIERTILAFETFNYEPQFKPNVYELALNEMIRRENEINKHPREFYSTISYLSLRGYYNFDLLNKILSEDYIKHVFNYKTLHKHNCHPSILCISNGVKIDCPEYSGVQISETLKQDIYQNRTWKFAKPSDNRLSSNDKTLLEVIALLQEMFGGSDYVHYTYIVPHLPRPDVIFCMDGDKPVKLPDKILSNTYVDIELPSKTEDWYAVTFFGLNTCIFESYEPIGNTVTKLRHLNKIGYNVLCVKENQWCNKSKEQKIKYLRELIQNSSPGTSKKIYTV